MKSWETFIIIVLLAAIAEKLGDLDWLSLSNISAWVFGAAAVASVIAIVIGISYLIASLLKRMWDNKGMTLFYGVVIAGFICLAYYTMPPG